MVEDNFKEEVLTPVIMENDKKPKNVNIKKIFFTIALIIIIFIICFALEKPKIIYAGDKSDKIECMSEFDGKDIIVKYHGKDIADRVKVFSNVDTSKVGKYTVTYEIPYLTGYYKYTRNVQVIDDVRPEINLNGQTEQTIYYKKQYKEEGYTAKDNCDGNITDKVETYNEKISDTKTNIHYKVKDSSGNEAEAIRVINYSDDINLIGEGVVYLTFDDGPSKSITPYLLDILKEKGVKATFFILDYGESTEYLVKRIVAEGHSIGIHGGSHEYAQVYSDANSYLNALEMMKEKIKTSTGVETNIIRFPGGSSNTVSRKYCPGIMTTLTQEVLKRGYKYYDWNVSSGDSGGAKTSEEVYNNVTSGLKLTKANMVLMHDFSGNKKTLNAISDIIDYGISNGYIFERITENTPMITQRVQN